MATVIQDIDPLEFWDTSLVKIESNFESLNSNKLEIDTYNSEKATQDDAIALNTAKRSYPLADENQLAQNTSDISDLETNKQDTLVSWTNIKTVNSQSLLGSWNIEITGWWAVDSVNTQTWDVVLDADDIDDTSTTNKFVQQDVVTTLWADDTTIPTSKAVADAIWDAGGGDMLKAVYDTDDNGIVDNSEALWGQNSAYHLDRTNHTGTQNLSTISDAGDLAWLDTVWTTEIDNKAVTNLKLENMNSNTVKGRLSGNGTPQDVSMADLPISTATQTALDWKLANSLTKSQLNTAVSDGDVAFLNSANNFTSTGDTSFAGNVWIKTTTPITTLDINKSWDNFDALIINDKSDLNNWMGLYFRTLSEWRVCVWDLADLSFCTNRTTKRMILKNNWNLLLWTTTDTGRKVQVNWTVWVDKINLVNQGTLPWTWDEWDLIRVNSDLYLRESGTWVLI